MDQLKLGFIGGGNMAKAIAEGLMQKGVLKNTQIFVSAPSASTLEYWDNLGVFTSHRNSEIIEKSDIIILAFKPYQLSKALANVSDSLPNNIGSKLFVSVLAGIKADVLFSTLKQSVQKNPRVIRSMPNTPLCVGEGCTVISPHSSASEDDVKTVKSLYQSVGKCEIIPEFLINASGSVAGSGPAFMYMILEAISDGGVKQGLPRDLATMFAAQTMLGAAKMVLETKKHPGQLKDEVCSPGGTTICGVVALEKGKIRSTLIDAIEVTARRGDEIGRGNQ